MVKIYKHVLAASAMGLLLALSTGCATTKQVNEARTLAEEAKMQAAAAERTANNAKAAADAAMRKAEEAERCCHDTNEKIDRMFKKSMQK